MFVEKWWISDKLSEWAGNHIFNRSTTLTHAHSQITPNSDFWNAMPLILPISGWSLFHLHLTSFSRVENENARLNSDLSSANLRWISNRSRQVFWEASWKRIFFFELHQLLHSPPPHPAQLACLLVQVNVFLDEKSHHCVLCIIEGKLLFWWWKLYPCWHYYQKMTIGIFLMMKLAWNKNQHVNESYSFSWGLQDRILLHFFIKNITPVWIKINWARNFEK